MFGAHDGSVGELLLAQGLVTARDLDEARAEQRLTGASLAQIVVNQGWVTRSDFWHAIARHLGASALDDVPAGLSVDILALLPAELARRFQVLPWREEGGDLAVLAVDPFQPTLREDLAFALGRGIRLRVGDPNRIEALWRRTYAAGEVATDLPEEVASVDTANMEDLAALAAQAPVVRFVNGTLAQAVRERASDLHFEPFEDEFRVRCRIDGALYELPPPPSALARAISSRLKLLANLDIAECRQPQDGRLRLGVAGRAVDLRVSTLPTQFGESVVLRVLDRSTTSLELGELGMPPEILRAVDGVIRRPNGLFAVTGPTGSGKTTTLYSCLRRLNETGAKLLTVEDPVEYEIEGVMQVPVNQASGLTFASALRAFLRHDPDIVMVGEIRDLETAQVATQAALTGHLVLATLHTNDAPGAITRLADMGVERFLLASTVEAVLAQRLVRRICPDCREACTPDPRALERLGITVESLSGGGCFRGRGCERCHGSGHRGRVGFFELLVVEDRMRELIASGAPLEVLREAAVARGMRSLRADGLRLVGAGITTPEELGRYV